MKDKVKHFLGEAVAIITLLAGLVTVLAVVALFFNVADSLLVLTFSVPVFVAGALLLTFVIKGGWSRVMGEAISSIFSGF